MIPSRTGKALAAVCAIALAGCAPSPIKRWEAPPQSEVREPTIDYAFTYANKARSSYQQAIDEQIGATTSLGGGLIAAGALMAAIAISKSHNDLLVALGLGSATAYALGNWNYNKQRQLIYMAGIEGVSCAVRAVTPLYISQANLNALKLALQEVINLTGPVARAVAALTSTGAGLPQADPARKEMEAAIADANARLEIARAVAKSGSQFVTVAGLAGVELINAVNRIDDAVGKALLDTIPDLTAVPKIVGSLAGLAGSFAPNAAAAKTIADRLGGATTDQAREKDKAGSRRTTDFDDKLGTLRALSDELANATALAQALLAGHDAGAGTDRLKDCGVAAVDTALRAKDIRKDVAPKKDATYRIGITGGVKPYTASFSKAPAEGLTIRNPVTYDEYIELVATKSLTETDTYILDIQDSGTQKKEVSVSIVVGGAAGTGGSGGASTPSTGSTRQDFVTRIKGKTPPTTWNLTGATGTTTAYFVVDEGTTFVEKGDVTVKVRCDKPQVTAPSQLEVSNAFRATFRTESAIESLFGDGVQPIFISDGSKCVAATTDQARERKAAAERVKTIPLASLDLAQLANIQKNLCMVDADLDGRWGPTTAGALARWRTSQPAGKSGPPAALTPREYLALHSPDPREVASRCKQ